MSVINNVLKDIQARPSQFVPIEIASVESAVGDQAKPSKTYTIAVILVVLMGALSYWFFQYYQESAEVVRRAEVVVDTPATPVPMVPTVTEPLAPANQIIDLQIRESVDDMSLEFSLQAKVVSYLKERGENSFVYFLKDIRSEIRAPVISNNRWIERLSISTLDEGVEVSFRTAPGILVETRQQPVGGGQAWIIKLKNPPQAVIVAKPVEIPLKSTVEPKPVESVPVEAVKIDVGSKTDTRVEAVEQPKPVKLDITSRKPELTDNEKLLKAIGLQKSRRWQQSETILKSLIDGSEDLAARQNLLSLYQYRRQAGNFSVLLQESLDRYPQQPMFRTAFARTLYESGDYQVVIEFLQDTSNKHATQLALIAASHQRLGQHAKAVEYYRLSLDKDQKQAKSWIGMGISQEQTGQLKDALRSYRIAARLGNINTRLQTFVDKRISQLAGAIY